MRKWPSQAFPLMCTVFLFCDSTFIVQNTYKLCDAFFLIKHFWCTLPKQSSTAKKTIRCQQKKFTFWLYYKAFWFSKIAALIFRLHFPIHSKSLTKNFKASCVVVTIFKRHLQLPVPWPLYHSSTAKRSRFLQAFRRSPSDVQLLSCASRLYSIV